MEITQLALELEARDYGMREAAERNEDWLEIFRMAAWDVFRRDGNADIERCRDMVASWGYPVVSGNWMGSVFKAGGWRAVGWRKAEHEGSHGRPVRIWTR